MEKAEDLWGSSSRNRGTSNKQRPKTMANEDCLYSTVETIRSGSGQGVEVPVEVSGDHGEIVRDRLRQGSGGFPHGKEEY